MRTRTKALRDLLKFLTDLCTIMFQRNILFSYSPSKRIKEDTIVDRKRKNGDEGWGN